MRPFAVLLLGVLLAGCVGQSPAAGLLDATTPKAEEARQGLLDEIADRIVQADTVQERALRLCLFSVVATEVGVYRLVTFGAEPGEADQLFGGMRRIRDTVARLRAIAEGPAGGIWVNTEVFYAVAQLTRAIEGPARSRTRALIGALLLQDLRSILKGVRTSAGQVALASAMMRDVKAAAESSKPSAELWSACLMRLEDNETRVAGLLGLRIPAADNDLRRRLSLDGPD